MVRYFIYLIKALVISVFFSVLFCASIEFLTELDGYWKGFIIGIGTCFISRIVIDCLEKPSNETI